MPPASGDVLRLGVPGFAYPDLRDPERLRALHDVFLQELAAADCTLAARWDAYRAAPAGVVPVERSALLVEMAPRVSAFVARLFGVERELAAMRAATLAQDPIFRFKVDFVRRRVLPMKKQREGGPGPDAGAPSPPADELALAAEACRLLDRETDLAATGSEAERAALASDVEALKRRVAALMDDPACRGWVSFHFPRSLDPYHLVEAVHPDPALPELLRARDGHRRRRDGFTLTDPRMGGREVLAESHYCVICHERDKDSCSKGFHAKDGTSRPTRWASPWRAARWTRRSPRCTGCGGRATLSAAWPSSSSTTRCAPAPATGSATTA